MVFITIVTGANLNQLITYLMDPLHQKEITTGVTGTPGVWSPQKLESQLWGSNQRIIDGPLASPYTLVYYIYNILQSYIL